MSDDKGTFGDLSEKVENIAKNPILKPLLDYNKASLMLEKEDVSESQYRDEREKELKVLLDTGIYENSLIAMKYNNLLEIYKRLLFIFSRYTGMADKKLVEVKEIVESYYITKQEHSNKISEINKQTNELKEENKNLLERIKILKEENKNLLDSKLPKKERKKGEEKKVKKKEEENLEKIKDALNG